MEIPICVLTGGLDRRIAGVQQQRQAELITFQFLRDRDVPPLDSRLVVRDGRRPAIDFDSIDDPGLVAFPLDLLQLHDDGVLDGLVLVVPDADVERFGFADRELPRISVGDQLAVASSVRM